MNTFRILKHKFEKMIFVHYINKITGISITTLNNIYDINTSDTSNIKLYVNKDGKLNYIKLGPNENI